MSVKRNGIGQIKREKPNRDYRRAHFIGAARLVQTGRPLDSFRGKVLMALKRYFA
jgi:hypothetical protein